MECKLLSVTLTVTKCNELIETLWNVNTAIRHPQTGTTIELIETLWNVNRIVRIIFQKYAEN